MPVNFTAQLAARHLCTYDLALVSEQAQTSQNAEAEVQRTETGISGGASSSSSSPPRALLNLLRCMSRLAAFLASTSGSS